jgi:hypothetical protein
MGTSAMATYLRLTAPVTLLICLQLISTGKVCATLQPKENLSRWSQTALLASKPPVPLKISQFEPPPPEGGNPSPKKTGAGGGR